MKKRNTSPGLVILCTLSLILLGAMAAHAETVKLTYSNFFPPTHIQSKLAESWCQEVEKRTNGQVKVEYYAGQTLTKAKQVYDGVVDEVRNIVGRNQLSRLLRNSLPCSSVGLNEFMNKPSNSILRR